MSRDGSAVSKVARIGPPIQPYKGGPGKALVHPFPPQKLHGQPIKEAELTTRMAALQIVPEAHRPLEEDVRLGWTETCLPPWDTRYPECKGYGNYPT